MDSAYDRKFEEMKKYIPFLESMIKRLENTSLDSNPRQAQLDKIRSLRDLLMDKKKRMKMENLLKCEQVLVNLYAKVEQREALPELKCDDTLQKEKTDLNKVRSKLKSVVSKLHQDTVETLPEIARASDTEEVCVPGSKEPALFQRRPNILAVTSTHLSSNSSKDSLSKRNYTRVLISPEPSEKIWPANEPSLSEKQLFSRRSPKNSPRKRSPSYYKKERKKNKAKYMQSKDLNITLNVPEDSLNSLNTTDILSRIINCSDNDVDITTLRELRTQILGELKETGANDDISDIILKSYKKKDKKGIKDIKMKNIDEVEEGELSDSESEAIESIYGSLVVLDKNKSVSMSNKSTDKEKPRKIQICLVINSEKAKPACTSDDSNKTPCIDTSDFETFNVKNVEKNNKESGLETISAESIYDDISNEFPIEDDSINKDGLNDETKTLIPKTSDTAKENVVVNENLILSSISNEKHGKNLVEIKVEDTTTNNRNKILELVQISESNSVLDEAQGDMKNKIKELEVKNKCHNDPILADKKVIDDSCILESSNAIENIPLLEPTKPVQVSEIDILQALKKEILSETTNVLNSDTKEDTLTTPLLHQPKITKVANAQEIGSKKRISIESYKAKSVTCDKSGTRSNTSDVSFKEDVLKKQSLKLTLKECERFNFLTKLTLTESSDDEDRSSLSLDGYTDFAPKSPDHEDFADTGLKPPVIIPNDRVQTVVIGSDTDVDMRKLLPNIKSNESTIKPVVSPITTHTRSDKESSNGNERVSNHLVDPRMKKDINSGTNQSPNPYSVNIEPRPSSNFITSTPAMHNINMDLTPSVNMNSNANNTGMIIPMQVLNLAQNMPLNMPPGMTQSVMSNMACPLIPNMTPSRTPNAGPNIIPKIPLLMTPSRITNVSTTPNIIGNMTPSMTPSRHTFECEDFSSPKHVYAPMFAVPEHRDGLDTPRDNRQTEWNYSENQSSFWDDGNSRNSATRDVDYRDTRNSAIPKDIDFRDSRNHSMQRDIDYRDFRNNYLQSNQSFDTRDSESMQFSSTPQNSYGILECPPTPTASFGIMEMPMTPIHSFGRLDCPSTPSHPFGRSEPLLPTPCLYNNQSVSRSHDPRVNRSSDYESNHYRDDDRERTYYRERKFNSGNPCHSDQNRHSSSSTFRRFRDQSVGRNERNKNFETFGRNYRDQTPRRESSVGRSYNRNDRDTGRPFNREYENDRYSRSRSNCGNRGHDYRNHNDSKNRREKSVSSTFSKESFSDSMKDSKERKFLENHKLNVHRHGGHSFTIDTSIKSTFQNTISTKKSSFDSRRERASSVGRTLLSSTMSNRASNRETKEIFSDSHMKNKDNNIRRACSVGRELIDDKLDFMNIKADLRSFKVKSDFTFSNDKFKTDVNRISTSFAKDCYPQTESEKNNAEAYEKCNSKYSPRKNNRDPRIRGYKQDDKDYRSNSQESKNYGIVYSTDNISKGRILGSGYGVKNYKIPKIKRQEVTEASKTSDNENIDGDNKSNAKDRTSDLKQKDVKIDVPVNLDKSESSGEKDINVVSKSNKSKYVKDSKISIKKNQKEKKPESCETEANSCQVNPIETTNTFTKTGKSKKKQLSESNICKEIKNDDDNNKAERKNDTNNDIMSGSSEIFERRLTRSARKNMSEECKTMEISPVKKPRTLKKKPSVLESDSEDDKLSTIKTLNTGQQEEPSQNILNSTTKQISHKNVSSIEDTVSGEKDINAGVVSNTTQDLLESSKEKSSISGLESDKQDRDEVSNSSENKFELNLTNEHLLHSKSIIAEKDKNKEDDLDSISDIDDLEMFPDNITSDPVIDSINVLIANLDHDLDSSKSVEINSHFTKELSLETMLENLTTPDKNDKKEVINDLSLEPELCVKHQAKVTEIEKTKIESDISMKDHMYKNPIEHADISLNFKKEDCVSRNEDESEILTFQNIQEAQSGSSAILSSTSNSNDDAQNREIGKVNVDSELESYHDNKLTKNIIKQQSHINEIDAEDTCSSEAIVSTSDDGNVCQTKIMFKTTQTLSKTNDNINSTPDSTITTEENLENVELNNGIITNESTCEMNSDITSTHVTETVDKDSLDVLPSDAGPSTQIESIGKLLSILQDKTKIKELLSLLGNQTAENEKIKKKLEKLSEIVSDDESVTANSTLPNSTATNVISNCDKQDSSVLEVDQNAKELNERVENENVDDKSDKNCGLNVQKEKLNEIKNDKVDDSKETNQCRVQTNSEINNISTTDNIANEIPVQENNISAVPDMLESDLNKQKDQQNFKTEKESTAKKNVYKKKVSRKAKKRNTNKSINMENRYFTRSDVNSLQQTPSYLNKPVIKKPSRELQKLQEDIREMFLKDDILSATGIRMCRIAKLVDETKVKDDQLPNDISCQEPLVVLKKCNELISSEKDTTAEKTLKKKVSKSRTKFPIMNKSDSKKSNIDPYDFETDSINEPNSVHNSRNNSSSDSETDSGGSNKSIESTEVLADMKKKVKRKRGKGWKAGVIKPKNKKKKIEQKAAMSGSDSTVTQIPKSPDFTCFTDRNYCFRKNVSTYHCRICLYNGTDIVHHYKKEHPHTEVPLSRMSPTVAKEAIKESEDQNFQAISKISSKKYICRFCFKEFGRKKRLLETFFWHIVSMHTGEYKQICSKCTNTQKCPLDIDIPPPPKDAKGQLLGYICEKCNYTQISLENLKTHVIVWHNDEQTAVYTVNLAFLSRAAITYLLKNCDPSSYDMEQPRILRSSRSNQSVAEGINDESDASLSFTEESIENMESVPEKNEIHVTTNKEPFTKEADKCMNIQSKLTFETESTDEISHYETDTDTDTKIKVESDTNETQEHTLEDTQIEKEKHADNIENRFNITKPKSLKVSDVFERPHFKINYTVTGAKEYICCINGKDKHYKTTLLISLKKHVQLKHSEKWDGYCCLCKVIVTPQGEHPFKDCLQHLLDKHIDNFPMLVEQQEQSQKINESSVTDEASASLTTENKSYINVRPISELITTPHVSCPEEISDPILPVVESVISFRSQTEQPHPSPSYPAIKKDNVEIEKKYKYEEFQAEIMSRKHPVVLESMMSHTKLVQIYKCAGRFCSFTTDNAENALLHASTHMRVGGVDSLSCVYCDFDSSGNAIDLITHVFKSHGCCKYVCATCFYRAAASQQVNAHIKRVHEKATNVAILKTQFQSAPIRDDNKLSREAAVPLYLCCDKSGPEPCKFRTYTPGKFCEHLQLRHASAIEHFCSICSAPSSTPGELIHHLKTHGLKLYQCAWCVFGADNEAELMAHASVHHHDRQPKAYLRIITNKEGFTDLRVLPLAQLNKSDLLVTEVAPNYQKDFPVREAERSIELEKLIGHTNLMIESMSTSTETDTKEKEPKSNIETNTHPDESPGNTNTSGTVEMPQAIPRMSTPSPCSNIDDQFHKQSTPIMKTETLELTPEKIPNSTSDIVCLDSDDDTTDQNLLVLDETNVNVNNPLVPLPCHDMEFKKVRLTELFLCPNCKMIVKCGSGFKKHINACYAGMSIPIQCAHCKTYVTKKTIVSHYNKHCDKESRYFCQECNIGFSYLTKFKEHQIYNHNTSTLKLTSSQAAKGRRKRSLDTRDRSSEPPDKVKRYGPQDIDKLPINPILDDVVVCSLCEFNTKVRLNMVRHLQLHAQQQPVPQTAPVNPVPHLETNEKHFDKMLNLASSSIVMRPTDKNTKADSSSAVLLAVPPQALSRYPKFVPEKQRLTCGAKDCSYISVEESMFKCHWETLHSDISEFHCVHCPSYQYMDTVKPLTASRIVAHLKMHDDTLYACSLCPFYHNRRQILEKHLLDVHKGGQIMVVRDSTMAQSGISAQPSTSQAKTSAPTMDLKPWQCGLCIFKSLLRPKVVEHCAKEHNSKMQYKCAYCAFRTSNPENITKHQAKSHVGKVEEIFYYYYREGSVSDEPDGTTRWQKQSQNSVPLESKVKSEDPSELSNTPQKLVPLNKPISPVVDLNLVKKETLEPIQETIEDLCKEFGEFCEPNGLKYKCSLCSNVVEDNPEAMQSHLYEELKYRKWGCSICSYKAFHKEGLNEHMQMEHRDNVDRSQNRGPIALPVDNRIETWVMKLLEHQTAQINKYKENLAIQKEEILRVNPSTTVPKPQPDQAKESKKTSIATPSTSSPVKPSIGTLVKIFGNFGAAEGTSYCCPKCNITIKDESDMKRHLETELNKIRWLCSSCCLHFQTYHEAQFHGRSVHTGQSTRPIEVTRDVSVRQAWTDAVISAQKNSINLALLQSKSTEKITENTADVYEPPENSLLVVRYEENIPTPEEEMARKTPAQMVDSDDEKLVIDEPIRIRKTRRSLHTCSHCPYETHQERLLRDHMLRHYGLKPYTCPYCGVNGARKYIENHQKTAHPTSLINLVYTTVPKESPSEYALKYSNSPSDVTKVVCLVCRSALTETESQLHVHDKVATAFGKRGQMVVKCSVCFTLHKDVSAYFKHQKSVHPNMSVNYVFTKLNTINFECKGLLYACSMCSQKFANMKDIKSHVDANHQSILKYTLVPKHNVPIIDLDLYEDNEVQGTKRKSDDVTIIPAKKTARKSTTKLPMSKSFARKSTTKLPYNCSEMGEFSYYGTKPSDDSNDVVTMMLFCNKMVPFTLNRLREIININPSLVVEKTVIDDELLE